MEDRLDPIYIASKPDFSRLRYPLSRLREICEDIFQGVTIQPASETDPIALKVKNLRGDEGIAFDDVENTPDVPKKKLLQCGDLLSPFIGEAIRQINFAVFPKTFQKCTVDGNVGVIRPNAQLVMTEYLQSWFQSSFGRNQIIRLIGGGGVPFLGAANVARLEIALPPLLEQRELVDAMEVARAERRAKLAEADALLASMDTYLLDALKLESPAPLRKVYAVKSQQLSDDLSAERYAALQLERALPWSSSVADAVELIDTRTIPGRIGPEEEWDWIRIDELRNQPWDVEAIRTERGDAIEGPMYKVRENDILLARLGPTILNAKFVLAPKPKRQTVASPEFLVLRCKQGWEPDVVLWLLRMKLFRDIMYLRSRGGTPSRYRLDGDDLLSISFPAAIDMPQQSIATEIRRRRERARTLRAEAEQGWSAAKRWFEEQLLGPAT